MPKIELQLSHRPSFIFEVDEETYENTSERELLRELSLEADIALSQETYSWNDWTLSAVEPGSDKDEMPPLNADEPDDG